MEVKVFLKEMAGKIVGIDTMSFIYAFEEHPTYIHIVRPLFDGIEKGDINGVTSTITVVECLVKPFEVGDISLLAKYRMIFRNFPNLIVFPTNLEVAEKAAELRAMYNVRTPDALQLSTSLIHNASIFITNDMPLSKVAGMKIIQLDDLVQ